MSAESKVTTDHDEIRQWVEQRGGHPSCVKGTGGKGDAGLLRIDFPGFSGEGKLGEISWDEFFKKFDENNLAFLHQDKTAGGQESRFNKLVSRDTAEQKTEPRKSSGRAASTRARSGSGAQSKSAAAKKSTPAKKSAGKRASASKPAASTSARSASPRKAAAPAGKSGTKKTGVKTAARKTTARRSGTR